MNTIKKMFFWVLIVLVLFGGGILLLLGGNKYDKIRTSEPKMGRFYLSCYRKTMTKKNFDLLVRRLVTENMDLKSMGSVITFIVNNKLCEFVPDIEAKCNLLSHFPPDTIWSVKLTDSYIKQWMPNEIGLKYSMCEKLEELKSTCNRCN